MKKKTTTKKKEATITEEETPVVVVESEEKKNFRALIEDYKLNNPAKYESKKDSLLAQLQALN